MEERAAYVVTQPNPTGIPARWLRFLYRVASLEGGRTYMLAITIPDKPGHEPTWAVIGDGKVENG